MIRDACKSNKSFTIAALLASLATAHAAGNSPTFNAPRGYRAGGVAELVATADLNHDGHPDVVSVASSYNQYSTAPFSVAILLGEGDDAFRQPINYTIGRSPTALVIGDFNGDGNPDIAVSDSAAYAGPGFVSILLGRGDGTFQPPVTYAAGPGPHGLAIGDFNGDGKLDLAVADYGLNHQPGSTVSILLGNGDGTFQAAETYPAGSQPWSVAVADFNGDGILDLAVSDYLGGKVAILFGNGNGSFQLPVFLSVSLANVGSAVTADFNGDGVTDLLVPWSNGYSDYFAVMLGNGDGTFQPPLNTYTNGNSSVAPVVGDFNGDGILDLVSIGSNGGYYTLLGNGNGTFQPEIYHAADFLSGLAVADFNHDGKLDLVVGAYDVFILLGNGAGYFGQAVQYPVNDISIAVGDFNGDGKPDVATVNNPSFNTTITILLNGSQQQLSFPAPNAYLLAVGDFNLDGKLDLAVSNTNNTVSIYLGNGDGSFQAPSSYAAGQTPYSLVVADFNHDGKPDVAVANYGKLANSGSNTVSVLLGNGNGTLQPQKTYDVGTNPIWMVAADFNGDGNIDLAIANSFSNNVSILLGKGDGTFSPQMITPVTLLPCFIAAGDFNGDGHPDLVVAYPGILLSPLGVPAPQNSPASNFNFVGVLLGNGDGTFQPQVKYEVGPWPASVAVADFDGDGIPDLAVGNIGQATVSIMLGNGDGTFRHENVDWFTGTNPFPLLVADMNGDGRPDIVTGSPVTVLTNTTSRQP